MIDILLATYNAERYLAAQIRSLQNQTFTDWHLLIHDDGSTDGTLAVVEAFAAADKRIELVADGKVFHSAAQNFLHLLHFSHAPFIIFCDGDDIWLEDKLEVLLAAIQAQDNTQPQAVWSDSYVYHPATNDISGRATLYAPRDLHDLLFANAGIQGCAILFNAALRDLCLTPPAVVAMHDHLLCLAAASFGGLTYVPRRLMLYRRHTATVTGKTDKTLSERVKTFFHHRAPVLDRRHYQAIQSFYQQHQSAMPVEARRVFAAFFRFSQRGRFANALCVFRDGFRLLGHRSLLAAKLLFRPLF